MSDFNDANCLKQFHHMNFSNLKHLELETVSIRDHDSIFRQLAQIPFPSLNSLAVTSNGDKNEIKYLKEKTVEDLVKNIPSLKSILLSTKMMAGLSEKFIIKMFKEANVIIMIDFSIGYGSAKYDKISQKNVGKIMYQEFQRIKNDCKEYRDNYVCTLLDGKW